MRKKLSILFAALLACTMSFAVEKTVVLDGSASELPTGTATTEVSTVSQNDFTYTLSAGAKTIASTGNKKFNGTDSCVLIGKSGAYIYNNEAFGEGITKFEVYVNKGAAGSSSKNCKLSVSFSESQIKAAATSAQVITIADDNDKDSVYTLTVPTNAKYFYYTITTAHNSQVAFRITYTAPNIAATGITLAPTTLTLDKGATAQLTATLIPANATSDVWWQSSDETVATVKDGLVTAVAAGKATITATESVAGYTAFCNVIVTAAPDAPTFTVADDYFEGSMNVSLAAAEGMKIYYTTNGDDPTTASTLYSAPFEITATTTIKAIAYDENIAKASVVAEKTYTKAMTCAEANAAADKTNIILNTVTVVYVNGSNTYVADATGSALIYKYNYGLKAGQVVKGLKGAISIYKNLPEIVPSSALADLTITEGTVPEPTVLTTVPTAALVNKYIKFEGVKFDNDYANYSTKTNANVVVGEDTLVVRNNFTLDFGDIKKDYAYNVIGFVAVYNTTVQLYPISIEQVFTVTATANDETMGIVKGAGSYAKDAEATLTATAKKGYQFVGWSDGTTANPYTFTVTADVNLTANFGVTPKHIYAYNLRSTLEDGVYTFSFSANEDATSAAILFYDADSSKYVGEQELTNVVKGENTCTIKEDSLPGENNQNLVWTVKLSAGAVNAFTEVYADEDWTYCRAHSNVDVNPESDFFGQVYVADRVKTKANSRFYVYSPDYVTKDAAGYQLGESIWDFGRFAISETGLLYLSDYGDAHSGIYVVNPADLTTTTQFFAGERESSGLWKNGDVETGSSVAACSFVGTGKDAKLVAVAEDYTGYSFPVAVYNVGQEDGTIATSWTTAPTKLFDTKGNAGQNFDIKGCAKGVWVATSRADGQNNSSATSLRFYDWDGNCTWSSADHTDVINGSLGGGVALTATEGQVILKAEGTTIKVFDITWVESTPTLTLSATYDCGYAAVSTINMDYAGNMVVIGGTAFGSSDKKRMKTAVFSVPTTDNTCEVPAKKAMVVTKKVAEESYIDNTTVEAAQTKKIVRNGQVLIIRDGKTYNMMGQVIE